MKTAIVLFAIGTLLVGCAKKKEYKEIYKESTFNKSLLSSDPNDPYVYVPSVENTPMNVTASRPYWQGEQKLVIFKFKEKNLEVLEIPSDKRFVSNENNFSPVFKLDIDHKSYRCAEDQYGECSNKEEEVDNLAWDKKQLFKADFSKLTVLETNSLPEQLTNLFQNCFSDKGSEVKTLRLDEDSLNITVERTISAGLECADLESFDDLRNLTFKVNYHYSFVKLSKLAAKDYRPVVYPFEDQNTFGFFTTVTKKLTADNRTTLDSDVTYLNRWNPDSKEIIYYLNDQFFDKDMESTLESTKKAVSAVNSSLSRAGVDMRIKLEDGRGKMIGDLRNSFLVMVKDPQASGVIGYGPTVANPKTGQILKGQVVMYYGTIRKFIQDTYEELVSEQREKALKAATEAAAIESSVVVDSSIRAGTTSELSRLNELSTNLRQGLLNELNIQQSIKTMVAAPVREMITQGIAPKMMEKLKSEIFSHDRILKHHSIEDHVEEMSRHNMYHESMMNWNGALESAMISGDLDLKDAKPWNDLSDNEKEIMIEKLMPYVWIPTLVHEIGHNLGLRHNFNGSEDKANYYSKEEGGKLGLGRAVSYSSVMDYSYSSLNQLPIMGKYDVAALAFGYNREVELKDGQIVKMPKATIEEMKKDKSAELLRDFRFCTDEHASVNPGCNRFDEGSTLKEMAEHYVRAYKKNFDKRYKRNNRLNFSSVKDAEHYSSIRHTFSELRIFFEVFDRIKGQYPGLPAEQWESMEFLKDLKEATKVAADFYLEVLKTPSVHCAVVDKSTGQLAGIIPLGDITMDAISCFDEENISINKEKYAVIAQTGKHFNHARSPSLRGDVKADPSQLDVRGIWMDKVLAMEFLTRRDMGISTFDDYRTSFLDHPEFKNEILSTFVDLMSDKIDQEVELETASGEKIPFKHSFEIGATHNVKKSFSSLLSRFLGMTKATTDVRELLFPMVKKNFMTADDDIQTLGLLKQITAFKVEPTVWIDPAEFSLVVELKDGQGRHATRFAASKSMVIAKSMMERREVRVKLEKFERAKLIQIFLGRKKGEEPKEVPEGDKVAYETDLDLVESFLLGQLPQDTTIQKLLSIMSK